MARAAKLMAFFCWSALAFVIPVAAAADTLPAGDQQLQYSAYQGGIVVPETDRRSSDLSTPLSYSYSGSPYLTAIANAAGSPSVAVSAITSDTSVGSSAHIRAALDYLVAVSGPDSTLDVPVLFSGFIAARAAGDGSYSASEGTVASATFQLQEYNGNPYVNGTTYLGEIFQRETDVSIMTGNEDVTRSSDIFSTVLVGAGSYLVPILTAEVSAQGGSSGTAFADPHFSIDPAFTSAHPGYSLSFSPFVGNDAPVTAVPEPATWAMMVIGFGFAGGALRRRTRKPAWTITRYS